MPMPDAFPVVVDQEDAKLTKEELATRYEHGDAEAAAMAETDTTETDVQPEGASQADGEVEQTSARAAEPKPEPKILDPQLTQVAAAKGIPQQLINACRSNAELERYLLLKSLDGGQPGARQAPPPAASAESRTPFERFALKMDFDPADYDEKIVGFVDQVKAMNKHYGDQFERVDKELAGLSGMGGTFKNWQQSQQLQQEAVRQQGFDAFISHLGEDYAEVFGSGDVSTLDRDGDQFQARAKVYRDANIARAGYRAMNQAAPPDAELYKAAVHAFLAEKGIVPQMTSERTRAAVAKRNGQAIAKPTAQRRQTVPVGAEEAAKYLDGVYRDSGMSVDTEPPPEW